MTDGVGENASEDQTPLARVSRSEWLRLLLCVTLMAGMAAAFYLTPLHGVLGDARAASAAVRRVGALAPAVFLVVGGLAVAVGFPRLLLTALGGLTFGFLHGLVWSVLATLLGQGAVFHLIRHGLATRLRERISRRSPPGLDRLLRRGGIASVIVFRQLPIHGAVINALLAMSPVGLRDYWIGSLIGFVPQAVPAALAGAATGHPSHMGSVTLWLTALAAVPAAWVLARALQRRCPDVDPPDLI